MGRHSADDDENDDLAASSVALEKVPTGHGRHERDAEVDERATALIAPISDDAQPDARTVDLPHLEPVEESGRATPAEATDAAGSVDAAPAAETPAVGATGRRESGTRADMRLLRESTSLRARCAAGVLAPFLIYTLVLIVMARTGIYLIWIWAPTVTAGVLVGAFLDLAHRRRSEP